jgi:hypothetical protein
MFFHNSLDYIEGFLVDPTARLVLRSATPLGAKFPLAHREGDTHMRPTKDWIRTRWHFEAAAKGAKGCVKIRILRA